MLIHCSKYLTLFCCWSCFKRTRNKMKTNDTGREKWWGWWWWWWWCCRASCPRMSVDTLGTNCDQCRSMVQCCFTSTETVRLIRTESPRRPPRLSHSSWTLSSSPAPPPCSWSLHWVWASFFVRVQLTSLLLISPGLWSRFCVSLLLALYTD